MKSNTHILKLRLLAASFAFAFVFALSLPAQGNLNPPSGSPQPEMKSLQEIWDKLDALEQSNNAQNQEIAALREQNANLLRETGAAPWKISEVINQASEVSAAKKPDGTRAIAYLDNFLQLWYAEYVAGTWQTTQVESGSATYNDPSLAISPSGNPGISYFDFNNTDLKYASFDGSQWTTEFVEISDDNIGRNSSLAFSPAGTPSITYEDKTNDRLRYAFLSVGLDFEVWFTSEVDSGTRVVEPSSHAYNAQGDPVVAYQDFGNGSLKYAVNQEGSWQSSVVDNSNADTGRHLSLAITPGGEPAIAYYEFSTKRLKYAQNFAGSPWWSINVVETEDRADDEIRLAFRPNGEPSISHTDFDGGDLYYSEHYQGEWRTDSVVTLGSIGTHDILINAAGEPEIFYEDGQSSINVARRDTSGE